MTLTEDQRRDLENLTGHPGYKVLLKIEEDEKRRLGDAMLSLDLDNEKEIEALKQNQIYCRAREDFFLNVQRHLQTIYGESAV